MAKRCVYCEHYESREDSDILYCHKWDAIVDDYVDDSEAKTCGHYVPDCEEGEEDNV